MGEYLGEVLRSCLSTVFIVFLIAMLGYLLGAVKIKGISLGTAGVLIMALIFGVVANGVGSFTIFGSTIDLFNDETIKPLYSFVSKVGTALFVTAVGLIAGPKFFRSFKKKSLSYLLMGFIIIGIGAATAIIIMVTTGTPSSMIAGLLTGALTSTPGFSAAKDAAADTDMVTAGYGIAYLFGVLGVVIFVQIVPKILKVNIEKERESYVAASAVTAGQTKKGLSKLDSLDFFPFMMTIALGMILGSIEIPGINFSLGSSGGTLIMGLIVGHFGHIGRIDLTVNKNTLNVFRELGLMLFLIGAGVPGGVNFVKYVSLSYFIYGAIMTLVPMLVGFFLAKYVFRLSIFNNLGSITGGMTSTPALGTLISVTGTDDVAASYATTYPIALVAIVLASKLIVMIF